MAIKQQFDNQGQVGEGSGLYFNLTHDYYLLMLVLGVLGLFYIVIMYILSSTNAERVARLDQLKKR